MFYSKQVIRKYRFLIVLLLFFIFMGTCLPTAAAAAGSNQLRVILNNKQLTFEVPPVIENGRTLVPVRAIFEAMGAEVGWNAVSRIVTASKGEITVTMPINSIRPKVNGSTCILDVPARIMNNRTLAPLRFVGEAFGGRVVWDSDTRTIYINNASVEKPVAAKVKSYLVNLRKGPSTLTAIIDHVHTGEVLTVLAEQDGWFKVSHGDRTAWVASWLVEARSTIEPDPDADVQAKIVVLDAGHGGTDPGAVGNTLKEKEANLKITLLVGEMLKQKGITVVYTRSDDHFVSLIERSSIANETNASLFVSIHNNANESSYYSGTETYFYAPADNPDLDAQRSEREALANAIQNALVSEIQRKDLGVKEANFSVLRNTMMTSALVEVAFVSNTTEEALLQTNEFISRAAEGIVNGIIAYLNQ